MDLLRFAEPVRSRPAFAYAVAIALSVCGLGVRLAIGDVLVGFPFLTFFPAVLIAGFLGGAGPGVAAAALSALLADYYLIAPIGSLGLTWPTGLLAMAFYAVVVGVIIFLIEGMRRAYAQTGEARAALMALNEDLERRVAARAAELEAATDERLAAQAQVRQMQKIEALGQLTGGIAHDFNNMLAIVIGSLDVARRRLRGDEDPKVPAAIANAAEGARRAAVLTARLLAFSRQQPLDPQVLDVNALVGDLSEMLRRTIGEAVRVETVLSGGLWRAHADPAQLESALLNLAVNARDAMETGGRLTIETANADLDDRYAREHSEVTAGQYVLLSVTDTGGGMPPAVVERVFEPFYTTKGVGKGTGLGLSQVYGFLKQSRGHVKIYSEVGRGTTVKLYLPRHVGAAPAQTARTADAPPPRGEANEIVLVVEDETDVRLMSVDALRELGYTVIHAGDGAEALELLASQPRVDLLFTDIVMPGMTGRQLADAAQARRPGLPVLYTTGYTRNAVVHNGVLDPGTSLLPKPFTLDQLAAKVRQAIPKKD